MGTGRKRDIKKIENESARNMTFSKRRKGLFKKAQQLQSLTGAKVSILVFSPAGQPFVHGDLSIIRAALNTFLRTNTTSTDGGSTTASNEIPDRH